MEVGHRRRRLYGLWVWGKPERHIPLSPKRQTTTLPFQILLRYGRPPPIQPHRTPKPPHPEHQPTPTPPLPPNPPTRLPSTTTNQHQYLSVRISTNTMNGSRLSIMAAPRHLFVVYFWLTEGFFEVMRMMQEATASCAWWLIIAPAVAPCRIMWPHVIVEECIEGPCMRTRTSTQNRSAEPSSSQPLTRGS